MGNWYYIVNDNIAKHLMKYYTNAAHGFGDPYFAAVRADVLTWFNGHKN